MGCILKHVLVVVLGRRLVQLGGLHLLANDRLLLLLFLFFLASVLLRGRHLLHSLRRLGGLGLPLVRAPLAVPAALPLGGKTKVVVFGLGRAPALLVELAGLAVTLV